MGGARELIHPSLMSPPPHKLNTKLGPVHMEENWRVKKLGDYRIAEYHYLDIKGQAEFFCYLVFLQKYDQMMKKG